MRYDHILIRYGELGLKGKNMKQFLVKLQNNIKAALTAFPNVIVRRTQGRLFVELHGENAELIIEELQKIYGIHSMSLAIKVDNELEAIKQGALTMLRENENINTFKVAVRRANKGFPIGSQEMNQLIGAHLLKNSENITVDVHDPELEVRIEIRERATYITSQNIQGAGGLPVGTAGKSLLLLSGGIDSPVAGHLMMKRGVQLEMIHFHSPPFTSERAKQKVLDLTRELTKFGGPIKVHLVPFTALQQAIFKDIPDKYAMTVMRRVMLKISEKICEENDILSITTGESLGQVASQTLASMHAINEVTNIPVLRPLVALDKADIIDHAKKIGTYDISILPYEDCCTVFVPKAPATSPKRETVLKFESRVDFSEHIDEAMSNIEEVFIKQADIIESTFDDLL